LMFLYITIFVVLLGASVNAEIHDTVQTQRAEPAHDAGPAPTSLPAGAGAARAEDDAAADRV